MPELPEVQSVVDDLAPVLTGRTITAVALQRAELFSLLQIRRKRRPGMGGPDPSPLLAGRTITAVFRRAKRIVLALNDGAHVYIHLGMTGHLTLHSPAAAAPPRSPSPDPLLPCSPAPLPLPHTHFTLSLSSPFSSPPSTLSFSDPRRFGHIVYLPPHHPIDADLGPEPLELSPADFHLRCRASRRPIKAALLDQSFLAGVGNIYADESLHAAGLHPKRRSDRLTASQSADLLSHLQRILLAAIAAKGSTLRDYRTPSGEKGDFQSSHRVYNRTGQPCLACGTPIRKITLAQRSTHFCPQCQSSRRR